MFKTKRRDEGIYCWDLSEEPQVVFLNSQNFNKLNTHLADLLPRAEAGAVASAVEEKT